MQVYGYILKPVDLGLLKKKINDIKKNMELEYQKRLYEDILNDIAQMQNTMLAVYNEKYVPIFYNKKLLNYLGYPSLETFLKEHKSLSSKFKHTEGYFSPKNNNIHWIEEIKSIASNKRIITMQNADMSKSKICLLSLSNITESKNIIVTFSEITSLVKEKRQYKHEAYTDELTQVDNRAKFNIVFERAIEQSKKHQSNLSMILLDIDYFKQINDNHGHTVGDNILKMFAKLILNNIRAEDSFSRWGGEEFVILLPNTSLRDAKNIAENLRVCIETYDFGINKKITCSFGVTAKIKKDTKTSLFERADKALYEAKDSGRNRVVVNT
ncbi:MAG TPA: GGDEF domain-containing protein [Epsilonproteobacteria bacterium]|nr:GGDEF domain-containing protein [Campylobacterota bacterium]